MADRSARAGNCRRVLDQGLRQLTCELWGGADVAGQLSYRERLACGERLLDGWDSLQGSAQRHQLASICAALRGPRRQALEVSDLLQRDPESLAESG